MSTVATRAIPDPSAEPTIPVKRAAAILGVSIRTVYNATVRGEIPAITVGKRVVIPTASFLAKYDELTKTPKLAA